MVCSLIAIITNHSCGKLLTVQFEFIGACFPLVDISIDHVALGESYVSLGIDEHDRVRPTTAQGYTWAPSEKPPACHPSSPNVLTRFLSLSTSSSREHGRNHPGKLKWAFSVGSSVTPLPWFLAALAVADTNLLIAEYGKSLNLLQSAPFRKLCFSSQPIGTHKYYSYQLYSRHSSFTSIVH